MAREQERYERIRPLVLFDVPVPERAAGGVDDAATGCGKAENRRCARRV
ncbi:MAG: hypothetical protein AVDCRST_MAG02-1852 [uncultured Rubrobacteraceae bacterium]|uniref:Uncharacterized protein n=1 Tax=uncultured Rubrobacteraceae bacterium TaxID=349277 RepID=A0A6J4R4Z1_9ACTN|nr:MAG: hypothetical protein AVDCRST_MAG02-1852 [uncultured Rubrobacteraceae bacterium]